MDNLRRFPAPWTMEEDKHGFSVKDAGRRPSSKTLHSSGYQYAHQLLSREEARRIAKAISRLPELLKRPQY